jgi:hypothetical protein
MGDEDYRCTAAEDKPLCNTPLWRSDRKCPLGRWEERIRVDGRRVKARFEGSEHDVAPVDDAEADQEVKSKREQRTKEHVRKQKMPRVEKIMDADLRGTDLTPEVILQAAVVLGVLPAWTAQEIRDKRRNRRGQ